MSFVNTLFVILLILIIFKVYIKLRVKWCKNTELLLGKTTIVTGANTGIGYEIALDFAKRGATVILACRNQEKAEAACKKIIKETKNTNVSAKIINLLSFESVRQFAKEINSTKDRLDILVNNAGVMSLKPEKTVNGNIPLTQTNYLSAFLLTNLLGNLLKKTENSRIINIASASAENAKFKLKTFQAYKGDNTSYCNSKLCNILFTKELAKRLSGTTSVTTYSIHPGFTNSDIFRNHSLFLKIMYNVLFKFFFLTCKEGAQSAIYVSVAKGIEEFSGQHFHNSQRVEPYDTTKVFGLAGELWDYTERCVNLQATEKQI